MIAEPSIPDPVTPAAGAKPAPDPNLNCASSTRELSASDRTLLFAYFAHHENLAALAPYLASNPLPEPGTSPADPAALDAAGSPLVPCAMSLVPSSDYFCLLTWLNQPHIQSALEAHDQAVARADRRRALDALRQSLESADNPTDLRRAATTLLRSTIAPRPAPTVNPDRKAEGSPGRGGARKMSSPIHGAPASPPPAPTPPSPPHLNHLHQPTPLPPLPPLPSSLPPPAPRAGSADHSAHIDAAQPDAEPPRAPCSDPPADLSPTTSPIHSPLPETRDPEHPRRQSG